MPESSWFAVDRAPQEGHDDDHEEQIRERIEDIDQPHDNGVGLPSDIPGRQPDWYTHDENDELNNEPDGK